MTILLIWVSISKTISHEQDFNKWLKCPRLCRLCRVKKNLKLGFVHMVECINRPLYNFLPRTFTWSANNIICVIYVLWKNLFGHCVLHNFNTLWSETLGVDQCINGWLFLWDRMKNVMNFKNAMDLPCIISLVLLTPTINSKILFLQFHGGLKISSTCTRPRLLPVNMKGSDSSCRLWCKANSVGQHFQLTLILTSTSGAGLNNRII